MLQYSVWANCCNQCDFCLRKERIPYSKEKMLHRLERIKKNLDTESDEKNKARLTDKLTIATSDMEKLKEEKERQIYSTIIITPDINDDNSKYKRSEEG